MEATLRKIGSLQPFSIPGVDALLNRYILWISPEFFLTSIAFVC